MLTIGRLGHGRAAADYYVDRQAGCELDYYAEAPGEPRGVWCGSGARGLGVARVLDGAGEALLRGLLDGVGPDGAPVVAPVWRGDPRGRLPTAVLVRAVEARAGELHVAPASLLGEASLPLWQAAVDAVAVDARVPRRPRSSLPVQVAQRLAVEAGLDPVEVFRDGEGRDMFAAAVPFADARVDVRRAGLDLTFSAPKSVSVLFGLGDGTVVEQVRAAHRVAVEQTLEYLETLCARGGRGKHVVGQPYRRVATDGWYAVAFEHRCSRSDDPQLHTHVVVPNVVRGVDGKWSAWDTSAAYRHALTGGYLYQAVLRGELTRRLGVTWGPVRRGVAEIEGVPAPLRRVFSRRRQAIEEHLEAAGQSGARAAQVALFATRPAKGKRTDEDLRATWRERARAAGFAPARVLSAALGASVRAVERAAGTDVAAVGARVFGRDGVTARSSTFDRRALLRAVCEAVPAGAAVSVESLRAMATDLVRDAAVVPLVGEAPVDTRRYSTVDLLATEAWALQAAGARADDALAVVDRPAVDAAVVTAGLSGEQAGAVRRLLTSGAGVDVVVGPAGAGKTAALRAAYDAWRVSGVDVRGAAQAAIAARTLQTGTGVPAQSLTRLRHGIAAGDVNRGLPAAGGVLLVDEAGMVGTRDLASLIELTDRARVKLVLVGDPAQLPEIDAGGLFDALTRTLPASVLSGNLRQRQPWERAALDLLRDGDVLDALDVYDAAGRVHVSDDAAGARAAIVTDYLDMRTATSSAVMLTSRRVDARVLNTLARRTLLERGGLGDETLVVRQGSSREVEWRVGDEAVVTANHYPLGLINGSRGRVAVVAADGVQVDTDAGRVHVPVAQLQAGTLEYGYALTCHKAQGITVDVALLFASSTLTREAGYVGMSRGRIENRVYATLDALLPEVDVELDHPHGDPVTSAERGELTRAALVQRLETRSAQRLALRQADTAARARLQLASVARVASRGR